VLICEVNVGRVTKYLAIPDLATRLLVEIPEVAKMLSAEMLDCRSLRPGSLIDVETKSRHYQIEYLGGNSIRVSGHPEYCPYPVLAKLQGALGQDGTLELGSIVCGMKLSFVLANNHPVTTSRVVNVNIDTPQPQ
jgi:hypothetical protein